MTWVDGTQLFYSNKQVGNCKLDFDTHAREGDFRKDPAENLSLGQTGTFVIQVTNFNDRDYADIPFKVLVRRSGQVSEASDAVFSFRWWFQDVSFLILPGRTIKFDYA